jgi:tetratricopeptide (TPR) repeat protein
VGLLAAPALADQTDPRLDGLFAALAAAPDAGTAEPIASEIWAIWAAAPDREAARAFEIAVTAMAARRWEVAGSALDRLVASHPQFAEAWNRRATLRWLTGDHAGSMHDIAATLELEPRHFGALSGMGLILMAAERDEAAIGAFERALELHPFLPGARHHLQLLERRRGGEPL